MTVSLTDNKNICEYNKNTDMYDFYDGSSVSAELMDNMTIVDWFYIKEVRETQLKNKHGKQT